MTVIPGLRTRFLAQGHRFLPRTVMARIAAKMLAPARRHATTGSKPGRRPAPPRLIADLVPAAARQVHDR
jgi:hypothetical protein